MNFPDDLRYTEEHEWVRVDGTTARVGITDYAQDALGDVVYVDLPQVGAAVAAMASCCEVESTKSVSEIFSPVSGTIAEVTRAGRHPDSDIFLDDITVSRRHAEIVRQADGFHVLDVGSLNGTYVNRDRVEEAKLANGDELQIGKFKLVFFTGH